MTEELQGQIDADELWSSPVDPSTSSAAPHVSRSRPLAHSGDANLVGPSAFADATADPDAAPRPSAPSPSTAPSHAAVKAPQSLPALLHLTARLVGGVMDRAVRAATGAHAQLGGEVSRVAAGEAPEADDATERVRVRTRVAQDGRLEEVWVRMSTGECFCSVLGLFRDLARSVTDHASCSQWASSVSSRPATLPASRRRRTRCGCRTALRCGWSTLTLASMERSCLAAPWSRRVVSPRSLAMPTAKGPLTLSRRRRNSPSATHDRKSRARQARLVP